MLNASRRGAVDLLCLVCMMQISSRAYSRHPKHVFRVCVQGCVCNRDEDCHRQQCSTLYGIPSHPVCQPHGLLPLDLKSQCQAPKVQLLHP